MPFWVLFRQGKSTPPEADTSRRADVTPPRLQGESPPPETGAGRQKDRCASAPERGRKRSGADAPPLEGAPPAAPVQVRTAGARLAAAHPLISPCISSICCTKMCNSFLKFSKCSSLGGQVPPKPGKTGRRDNDKHRTSRTMKRRPVRESATQRHCIREVEYVN